jgi:hypothetical protein
MMGRSYGDDKVEKRESVGIQWRRRMFLIVRVLGSHWQDKPRLNGTTEG